ncbi:MAG: uracil-DNA glycosylase [bacterium]
MENIQRLALELHNYLTAQNNMEPPQIKPVEGENMTESEEINEQNENEEDRREKLNLAKDNISGCEKCELADNRTQIVYGQGDVTARIMVVGEAPGAREDEQGLPFVGPSGKLLRGGFEKVGLADDDIYITNVVKCRPPDNRDPRSEELQSCRPYLDRQLEIIDPEVILTVGNFGLRYFLGEDRNISSSRGEVYTWQDRPLVPTYHPGYILRNRSQADSFVRDLKLAADQFK